MKKGKKDTQKLVNSREKYDIDVLWISSKSFCKDSTWFWSWHSKSLGHHSWYFLFSILTEKDVKMPKQMTLTSKCVQSTCLLVKIHNTCRGLAIHAVKYILRRGLPKVGKVKWKNLRKKDQALSVRPVGPLSQGRVLEKEGPSNGREIEKIYVFDSC